MSKVLLKADNLIFFKSKYNNIKSLVLKLAILNSTF